MRVWLARGYGLVSEYGVIHLKYVWIRIRRPYTYGPYGHDRKTINHSSHLIPRKTPVWELCLNTIKPTAYGKQPVFMHCELRLAFANFRLQEFDSATLDRRAQFVALTRVRCTLVIWLGNESSGRQRFYPRWVKSPNPGTNLQPKYLWGQLMNCKSPQSCSHVMECPGLSGPKHLSPQNCRPVQGKALDERDGLLGCLIINGYHVIAWLLRELPFHYSSLCHYSSLDTCPLVFLFSLSSVELRQLSNFPRPRQHARVNTLQCTYRTKFL